MYEKGFPLKFFLARQKTFPGFFLLTSPVGVCALRVAACAQSHADGRARGAGLFGWFSKQELRRRSPSEAGTELGSESWCTGRDERA